MSTCGINKDGRSARILVRGAERLCIGQTTFVGNNDPVQNGIVRRVRCGQYAQCLSRACEYLPMAIERFQRGRVVLPQQRFQFCQTVEDADLRWVLLKCNYAGHSIVRLGRCRKS